VILWPVGTSLVLAWAIFRDPALDYRLLVGGALLPDLVDAPFGGARFAHTLLASVAVLAIVMVTTRGRRDARRRLLALPIGMFLHLLADGMWARTATFWWPAFGSTLHGGLPAFDVGPAVIVLKELVGGAALAWWCRRVGLGDREVRSQLFRTGRLPRRVLDR
jgi:membrane-bound metal-dependent hydrolase YbcI (DUF457 family)